MFGVTDIIYEPDKPGEAQETLSNNTLARHVLNWNPSKNIEDYIENYIYAN